MGINGLTDHIKSTSHIWSKDTPMSRYKGKIVSIDAGCLYAKVAAEVKIILSKTSVEELVKDDFVITLDDMREGFSAKFTRLIYEFTTSGVQPLVVFDGQASVEKSGTKAKREAIRIAAQDNIRLIRDVYKSKGDIPTESIVSLRASLGKVFHIGKEHFDHCKSILRLLRIPYLQSTEESERLCAALVHDGVCKAAYSEDSDMIAHLCPLWIRSFSSVQRQKNLVKYRDVTCKVVRPHRVAEALNMTTSQLVEYCIMLGCDYNERVKGIGTVKAYDLLIKHKDIGKCYKASDIPTLNIDKCKRLFSRKYAADMVDQTNSWGFIIDDTYSVCIDPLSRSDKPESYIADKYKLICNTSSVTTLLSIYKDIRSMSS